MPNNNAKLNNDASSQEWTNIIHTLPSPFNLLKNLMLQLPFSLSPAYFFISAITTGIQQGLGMNILMVSSIHVIASVITTAAKEGWNIVSKSGNINLTLHILFLAKPLRLIQSYRLRKKCICVVREDNENELISE